MLRLSCCSTREIPFLDGWSLGIRLHALRSEDGARRGRHAGSNRNQRRQRSFERNGAVVRRNRVEQKAQDRRSANSTCRSRRGPPSSRFQKHPTPGPRAGQASASHCFVVKTEPPTCGVVIKNPVRTGDVVGGSSRFFVPAGGEFVTQAGLEGQIRKQFDGVFEISGAEEASPAQFVRIGHHLKRCNGALQERCKLAKLACPSWRDAVSSLS